MTNTTKLKVLAEADGVKPTTKCPYCCEGFTGNEQDHYPCKSCNATGIISPTIFPKKDYLHSYDAIIPLIVKQPHVIKVEVMRLLNRELGHFRIFEATQTQLADALIRALGKWQD